MLKTGDRVKFYYKNFDYGKITDNRYNVYQIMYKIKSETTHEYFWRIECELLKIVTIYAGIF